MELTIEQALQQAIEAHKAGKLQEAEGLYRAILQTQPNHSDANHNLGVLAVSVGKSETALPLYKTALEANPKQGQFWISYIDALINAKQLDNARNVLEQGKKLGLAGERIDLLETQINASHANLDFRKLEDSELTPAIEFREAGKYSEAEDWLNRFLVHNSSHAEALSLLAHVFMLNKKMEKAATVLSKAILINSDLPSVQRNQARLLLAQSKPIEALTKAQSGYQQSLEDPESWVVLAACLGANQKDQEALPLIEKALNARPSYAEAFGNRALIRLRGKDITGAIKDIEAALTLKPHLASLWGLLGSLRKQDNNLSGAIEALENAHRQEPTNVAYTVELGDLLRQGERVTEAISFLEDATNIAPENANAWTNLGVVFQQEGRIDEAKKAYEKALAINSISPEISNNLGVMAYQAKDWMLALQYFEQALKLKQDFADAQYNLGTTLVELDRFVDAEASFLKALALKPNFADTLSNFGNLLKLMHRYVDALALISKAWALDRTSGCTLQSHSTILAYMSNYKDVSKLSEEALRHAQTSVAKKNEISIIWEGRLYIWIYHPYLSDQEICAEHIKWGSQYAKFGQEGFADHDRSPDRRIRIGYVSPDFRGHNCRFYYEPLFSSHDHTRFELFAYSNVVREDEITERMKPYFDEWRNILGLSDEAVAQMIRKDKIDILVDGCGHMKGTRLTVFAHKPAPIQVTWQGSSWTTGLPQMDYVLYDTYTAPKGAVASEQIVRLPRTWSAFRPGEKGMQSEVKQAPAVRNGYVTFGYTGRTERLNDGVFHAWGRILKRLPQARLVLDFKPFNDPKTQSYYRKFLEEQGVDTTRVVMRSSENIFEGLGDIDILLDSFPHNGGTMLFDALWMGVPAVTLASSRPVGRIGMSLMSNLGLPEWAAQSEQAYEDKAVAFAQDIATLVSLRGTMRVRMQSSPVMDEAGFARDVESAFKNMWHKWCSEAKLSDKVSDIDEIKITKSKLSSEQGE